ncbi:MAG: glycosyltransferase family 39 protein [Candidatus Coatesbacteria bacterium]|nr:glycosyltransferase family 39 protein [Candidatus Coatesbacteria bacterium]
MSNAKAFLILVFAALVIRAIVLLATPAMPEFRYFNVDEADYELIAKNLYEHNGYCYIKGQPTAFRPPLYPLMIAGVYQVVGGRSISAVRWSQALISAVTAGLIFSLGCLLFGRTAGLFAGAIFTVYPTMLEFVPQLLSETAFIFLLTGAVYLLVLAIKRGTAGMFALPGLAFGAAFLCRPVLFLFLVGLFLPMMLFLARRGVVQKPLMRGAVLLLSCATVVSPWAIRNYVVFSEFIPTDTHTGWVLWHNTKVHFSFDADLERAQREIEAQAASGKLTSEAFFDAVQRHNPYGAEAQLDGIRKAYNPAVMPQTETEISAFFTEKSLEFFRENKLGLVRDRIANFVNFWMPISSIEGRKGEYLYAYGVIAVFAAIGLVLAIKRRKLLELLPLLLLVANFWLTMTLVVYHSRLKMPADIVTIVLAGYSMDAIRREKGLKWLVCIAAAAIGLNLITALFLLPLKQLVKAVF